MFIKPLILLTLWDTVNPLDFEGVKNAICVLCKLQCEDSSQSINPYKNKGIRQTPLSDQHIYDRNTNPTYSYSDKAINLIVEQIKKAPEHIVQSLKAKVGKPTPGAKDSKP